MSLKRQIVVSVVLSAGLAAASLLYRDSPTVTDDQSQPGVVGACTIAHLGVTRPVPCDNDVSQLGWPLPAVTVISDDRNVEHPAVDPWAAADVALALLASFGLVWLTGLARRNSLAGRVPPLMKRRVAVGLLLATGLTLASLLYRAPYHANEFCIDFDCEYRNSPQNLNEIGLGWPRRALTLDNGEINLRTLDAAGLAVDFGLAAVLGLAAAVLVVRPKD